MDIAPVNPVAQAVPKPVTSLNDEQLAANRPVVMAVRALNQAEFLGENNELAFQWDRESQRLIIQLVDRQTKEVLQQIPPEYILRAAETLRLR